MARQRTDSESGQVARTGYRAIMGQAFLHVIRDGTKGTRSGAMHDPAKAACRASGAETTSSRSSISSLHFQKAGRLLACDTVRNSLKTRFEDHVQIGCLRSATNQSGKRHSVQRHL